MAEQITFTRRYFNQFKNRNVVEVPLNTQPQTTPDLSDLTQTINQIASSINLTAQSLGQVSQSLATQSIQLDNLQTTSRSLNASKIFVNKEIPSGSIDGINTTYILEHEPTLGSDHVYLNGLLIEDGTDTDYSISGSTITFDEPLFPGMKLHCTYYYSDSTPVKVLVDKEIPIGLIDGVNNIYTLQNTPIENSEHVYLNGLLQEGDGNDYTISENIITFLNSPEENIKLRVTYYHLM